MECLVLSTVCAATRALVSCCMCAPDNKQLLGYCYCCHSLHDNSAKAFSQELVPCAIHAFNSCIQHLSFYCGPGYISGHNSEQNSTQILMYREFHGTLMKYSQKKSLLHHAGQMPEAGISEISLGKKCLMVSRSELGERARHHYSGQGELFLEKAL